MGQPDFAGKVVVVYIRAGLFYDQPNWPLENPRFEEQGGKLFLVGSTVAVDPANESWVGNTTIGIEWASVSHYLVFDSIAAYRTRVNQYKKHEDSRRPFWSRRT